MRFLSVAIFLCLGLSLSGCTLDDISTEKLNLLATSFTAVSKAARPLTDQEEYYVGRAVAASLLARYKLLDDQRLTGYLNLVGHAVAIQSEKPSTFGGYHFAILDSPEINAFACPGGSIFITRGMLKAVTTEEELAAVLAHEVGHVNHRDGVAAISQSRWAEAVTIIGSEAAKTYGSADLAKLTKVFEGAIDDVVKTLVVNGYGRDQELAADRAALVYSSKAGYDASALPAFIRKLSGGGTGSKGGMLQTHPSNAERIENVTSSIPSQSIDSASLKKRSSRFSSYIQ